MANVLHIDDLMILTAVPRVAVNFGKPNQRALERVTLSEIKKIARKGISRRAAWARRSTPRSSFWKVAAAAS